MDNFNLKKFLIENKITANSRILNEVKGPDSITVKVTPEGKTRMNLYNSPENVTMTNGDQLYFIGNEKYEVNKAVNVYFASYTADPAIIYISYVVTSPENDFNKLTSNKMINRNQLKNIVPLASCDFKNGFEKGMKDNRGYFEIV
jgi:hypothetical protein